MGASTYRVVVNDAEQYSIWPAGADLPPGWADAGMTGSQDDCLARIDRVWVDLRPAGVRARLAG
ncbi:MbtH family protein [Actinosynnema sp. NPDC047251]|uniref:Putative MbtH-like protein n=1 Tax=Saccharothrix espanaensis (strain ATCC 51144 / DSM 44229 / JCM 9112 / NBRC 15066 / NRRL 15764) TaxID=1179773 RepID=K0JW82_SACES|nr:MbtH family protein [Saccharothrix espanaensis]CCH32070.1 putative MbtH-like protein [Saccharothrix espanaensis DSM 44229]